MSQFAESLARLYAHNRVGEGKLKELLNAKKINQQEYDYIISVQKVV